MKWLKRMSLVLLVVPVLSIVCAPLPIGAATYYVDPVNGSNAHNGLTPATAWKQVLPAGSGHTIVTLGDPEAPRKSAVPAAASAVRAPGPATLDTGEVQRVVLGKETLAGWTPSLYSKSIWKAECLKSPSSINRNGVWLQYGCEKDFLDPGQWFWDSISSTLYLSDPEGSPDLTGKTIVASGFEWDTGPWEIEVAGWTSSSPRVFQVPFTTLPIYLMLDGVHPGTLNKQIY